MTTLQLDLFTKEIEIFQRKLDIETDIHKKASMQGMINRLIRKRDSLSKQLFKMNYSDAVTSKKYEVWE